MYSYLFHFGISFGKRRNLEMELLQTKSYLDRERRVCSEKMALCRVIFCGSSICTYIAMYCVRKWFFEKYMRVSRLKKNRRKRNWGKTAKQLDDRSIVIRVHVYSENLTEISPSGPQLLLFGHHEPVSFTSTREIRNRPS